MEYLPVACMRQSSRCCRSESLGCLPRGFPSARGGADLVEAAAGAGGAGKAVIVCVWIGGNWVYLSWMMGR